MCILPTASVVEASVTQGSTRGHCVQGASKTRFEDWTVQNCGPLDPGLRRMQIIASGSLAWGMWYRRDGTSFGTSGS